MGVLLGMTRSRQSREVLGGGVGSGERDEYRAGADGGDRAMVEEQGLGGPTQETAQENTMETLKKRVPTGIKTTA